MSTRRSLGFAFLDRYASLAVGVASSMILARLLTPAEVGVFSVAMALLALVQTVRDLGAGQYLLQERELTTDRIRAVWAVQLALGLGLGALVALASTPVAGFYAEPRMRDIMLLLALNYVVNPFGSVTYAWLMREMRYDAIAFIRFSSTLSGAVASVLLARAGHGPISLAWGSLCTTCVNALVAVMFRPSGYPWRPGIREVRRVLAFGTRLTSTSIVETVASAAPEFVLGKLQGLAAAGLYSRANGLVAMIDRLVTDAVYSVSVSLFSKEARESRDLAASFVNALSYVTALSWSFSLTLVFIAHPAIRVLYGPQWDASSDVARLLAAAMVFAAPVPVCMAALIGSGAVGKVLRATLTSGACTVVFVAIGAWVGMIEASAAMLLSAVFAGVVWLRIAHDVLGFEWRALLTSAAASLRVALATAAIPALTCAALGPRPAQSALALAIASVGAVAGFFAGLHLAQHDLAHEVARIAEGLRRRAP